jgi:hypothetical protein
VRVLNILDDIRTLAFIVLYLTDVAQSHLNLDKLVMLLFHRPFEINYVFCFNMLSIRNHTDLILHKNICKSFLSFCQSQLIGIPSSQECLNLIGVHVNQVIVFFLNRINTTSNRVYMLIMSEASIAQLLLLLLLHLSFESMIGE